MGFLMMLISAILGLVITAVINRLMALYYCIILLILGIWLLIHYWDSVFPVLQYIIFLSLFLIGTVFTLIFFLFIVRLISEGIESLIAYLKNKINGR